jgi:hypothetical protein
MTKLESAVIEQLEQDTLAFFGKRVPVPVPESEELPILSACAADLVEVVDPPTLIDVIEAIKNLNIDVSRLLDFCNDLNHTREETLSAIKDLSIDLYNIKSRLGM